MPYPELGAHIKEHLDGLVTDQGDLEIGPDDAEFLGRPKEACKVSDLDIFELLQYALTTAVVQRDGVVELFNAVAEEKNKLVRVLNRIMAEKMGEKAKGNGGGLVLPDHMNRAQRRRRR